LIYSCITQTVIRGSGDYLVFYLKSNPPSTDRYYNSMKTRILTDQMFLIISLAAHPGQRGHIIKRPKKKRKIIPA
jgi:hypothetical protein